MRGGPSVVDYPACRDRRVQLGGENPARWLAFGLTDMVVTHLDSMALQSDKVRARAWYEVAEEHFSQNRPLVSVCWQVFEALRDGHNVRVVEDDGHVSVVSVGDGEAETVDSQPVDEVTDDGGDQDDDVLDAEPESESESEPEREHELVTVAIGDLPDPEREYVSDEARAREGDDVYRNAAMFSTADCRERLLDEYARGVERQPHIVDALEDRLEDDGGDVPDDDVVVEVPVAKAGVETAMEETDAGETATTAESGTETEEETETDAHETGDLLMGAMS